MQTFLPYPDFEKSAKVLDYRRLGKQRVEALQILNILTGNTNKKGWRNHPAVLMWKGYERALMKYTNVIIAEWIRRGYKNNIPLYKIGRGRIKMPPWLGHPNFHLSHRSNLMRKDRDHYSQYFNTVDDLPYMWPVRRK
jgi:hypothetical protein